MLSIEHYNSFRDESSQIHIHPWVKQPYNAPKAHTVILGIFVLLFTILLTENKIRKEDSYTYKISLILLNLLFQNEHSKWML